MSGTAGSLGSGGVGAGTGLKEPNPKPQIPSRRGNSPTVEQTSRAELRPLHTQTPGTTVTQTKPLLSIMQSSCPGPLALTSSPPRSWHPSPPDHAYLSSWASQPRAGRRRYLSSSQSPWRPGERSSSRVSYTFLGAEAAGAEPPVSTGSEKLACGRVGSGEGRRSLPSQPDRPSQNCGEVMSLLE